MIIRRMCNKPPNNDNNNDNDNNHDNNHDNNDNDNDSNDNDSNKGLRALAGPPLKGLRPIFKLRIYDFGI